MVSQRLAKPSNSNVVGVRFSHTPLPRQGSICLNAIVAKKDRAQQNGYWSQMQVPDAPKGINSPTAGKLR